MQLTNTHTRYGAVTKTFHWLTALLILSAIPLGFIANDIAHAIKDPDIATTDADITRAVLLFSLHKTIGVASFFVALARIVWAISQPKPGLLNGDKKVESFAAETVHWLLYGSLLLAPLSGWIHHAATTGFAPIWWPFGQSLPFIPKDEALAETLAQAHLVFTWTLVGALLAHIGGALKHHVIDRDATLRRMLPGTLSDLTAAQPAARQPGHRSAAISAVAVWALMLGGGTAAGMFTHHSPVAAVADSTAEIEPVVQVAPAPTDGADNWQVVDGTLGISIRQMGSEVTGGFADWQARINYSETADADGNFGSVEVVVTIASLTLGTVTGQAMGAEYFDAESFPQARFSADIVKDGKGLVARGTLTIKDNSIPVELPFELQIDGDQAQANGIMSVDRRDFGIGAADEGNVGAEVSITFELNATRLGDTG
ncbi:MAG: cytochrome b/b6 domain-containing protein [Pseudomonadota bacterium]